MGLGKLNEKGDSLITVLAAVAIGSIAIAGTTTHFVNVVGNVKYINSSLEATSLKEELRGLITQTNSCTVNFVGLTLPQGENRLAIPSLKQADATGAAALPAPLLAVAQTVANGLTVRSISLHTRQQILPTEYLADIELDFDNPNASVATLRRKIAVSVTVNGSSIVSCRPVGTSGGGSGSGGLAKCPAKTAMIPNANPSYPGTPMELPEAFISYSITIPDRLNSNCTVSSQCRLVAPDRAEWSNPGFNCPTPELGSGAF